MGCRWEGRRVGDGEGVGGECAWRDVGVGFGGEEGGGLRGGEGGGRGVGDPVHGGISVKTRVGIKRWVCVFIGYITISSWHVVIVICIVIVDIAIIVAIGIVIIGCYYYIVVIIVVVVLVIVKRDICVGVEVIECGRGDRGERKKGGGGVARVRARVIWRVFARSELEHGRDRNHKFTQNSFQILYDGAEIGTTVGLVVPTLLD